MESHLYHLNVNIALNILHFLLWIIFPSFDGEKNKVTEVELTDVITLETSVVKLYLQCFLDIWR